MTLSTLFIIIENSRGVSDQRSGNTHDTSKRKIVSKHEIVKTANGLLAVRYRKKATNKIQVFVSATIRVVLLDIQSATCREKSSQFLNSLLQIFTDHVPFHYLPEQV